MKKKPFNPLEMLVIEKGATDGAILSLEVAIRISREMTNAFMLEALRAKDEGKTFLEWFHGEDPHARFVRLLKASSAPQWLVERYEVKRES